MIAVEPRVVFQLGVAIVSWPPPVGVDVTFDLMRLERRGGEISGQIEVRSTRVDDDGILHQARLNMSSTRSREEVARLLARRRSDLGSDAWSEIIDQACINASRRYLAGRPAFTLASAQPPATGDADALPPLLVGSGPTIWFGDGGAGKSQLGLAAAASLHIGEPILGIQPPVPLRVALLDWEWAPWPHKERLSRLLGVDPRAAGAGDLPDVLYVPCQSEGPLTAQVDRLRGIFREHRVEFAVLDSVGYACEGPPEEAESALSFFRALARLEVGSLLLAHVNRSGDTDRPFGSTFWHNSARSTWFLKAQAQVGETLTVGFFNRKANGRPLAKPLGIQLRFTPDRTYVERVDVQDVPELDSARPLRARISDELRSGPLAIFELASLLSASADSIEKTLKRGLGRDFVRLEGGGKATKWALPVAPGLVAP